MLEGLTKCLQKSVNGCADKHVTERTGKKRKIKHGKTSFYDDYAVSVDIAWQLKDLLKSNDTRKAVLGSRNLESGFYALKVISEFSIKECLQYDYIRNSHVDAYTSLGLYLSSANTTVDDNMNSDMKNLEKTIEHLVHCAEKVYKTAAARNSIKVTPCAISNMVKLSTSILKFMIDSSSVNRTRECHERCLSFTRKYVQFVILYLRQYSHGLLEFNEEDLKETFLCIKSAFTYAAKLLNLVLTSSSESNPPSLEAHNLASDLFDLIISIEEHLGRRYGSLVLTAVKLWLPDLILALGSLQMHKQSSSSSSAFGETKFGFPSWLLILAKIEILDGFPSWLLILAKIEILDDNEDNEDSYEKKVTLSSNFSIFRKVTETMVEMLRGNQSMLDAVGAFLLTGSMVGLEKEDFELLYGVLRFVCLKLVDSENGEWVDLKLMLESVQQMYPRIETMVREVGTGHEKVIYVSHRPNTKPMNQLLWRLPP